jgi:hypothetical protein
MISNITKNPEDAIRGTCFSYLMPQAKDVKGHCGFLTMGFVESIFRVSLNNSPT